MSATEEPSTWAVDSSVLIAGLLVWHEHHDVAHRRMDQLAESGHELILPIHSLIETYSVLTRLPAPHRLSPLAARDLLAAYRTSMRLVGLPEEEAWKLVDAWGDRGIAGGRTYDALIAASARRGGANRILTLNTRHYEDLAPGLEAVFP
jgi:predicted nucleic acid-binding protein